MYEGRTDSQIKVRGHRVDLTEVEKIVATAPAVDKAVVLCYKPGELSQVTGFSSYNFSFFCTTICTNTILHNYFYPFTEFGSVCNVEEKCLHFRSTNRGLFAQNSAALHDATSGCCQFHPFAHKRQN